MLNIISTFAFLFFVNIIYGSGEEMVDRLNDYRALNGLNRIPYSSTLATVADTHITNILYAIKMSTYDQSETSHSWYDNPSGLYTSCWYDKNKPSACMWDKPKEISSNYFTGDGFEIAYRNWGYSSMEQSLESVIDGWKKSSGHNVVILNQNIWSEYTWRSLGCSAHFNKESTVSNPNIYYCWFSEESDPNSITTECEYVLEFEGGSGVSLFLNTLEWIRMDDYHFMSNDDEYYMYLVNNCHEADWWIIVAADSDIDDDKAVCDQAIARCKRANINDCDGNWVFKQENKVGHVLHAGVQISTIGEKCL